jgi:hypothetical protein
VILKFNAQELAELDQYANGPFGEEHFYSFMAEVCARTDRNTGEVDLDGDILSCWRMILPFPVLIGQQFNQKAIYDLKNFADIPTGGTTMVLVVIGCRRVQ